MDAVISYPKAMFRTLTYCEKKDYVLCCLHEVFKGTNELYHDQELQEKIAKLINEVENRQN